MDHPPTDASPLLGLAKFAVFLWPLLWFIPSAMCCSAPLAPFATPAGELANVLRIFASPLALAAGLAAGGAVLSVFATLARFQHAAEDVGLQQPGGRRVPSGFGLATLVFCLTYIATYSAFGLITGALAGAVMLTTAAYAVIATFSLVALVTPFMLLALAAPRKSAPISELARPNRAP